MKKYIGILLILLAVTASACGKQHKSSQSEEKEPGNAPMEVQVPTQTPTGQPTEVPTEQPKETAAPTEGAATEQGLSNDTAKIKEYFRINLPEEYTMLTDDKNNVVTIARDGRKIGRISLHPSYRGKREAVGMIKELLDKEGYAKSVKTYTKQSYLMSKVTMEIGVTQEDIQHGKLFSGNEALIYLYYQDQTPTTVLTFEVTNLELEAAMDKVASTIELLK